MRTSAQQEQPDPFIEAAGLVIRGNGQSSLGRAYRRGELVKIVPRFYARTTDWVGAGYDGRWWMTLVAALLANPDRVFCGETALRLAGFWTATPEEITFLTSDHSHAGSLPFAWRVHGNSPEQREARTYPPARVKRHVHPKHRDLDSRGSATFLRARDSSFEMLVAKDGRRAMAVADGLCLSAGQHWDVWKAQLHQQASEHEVGSSRRRAMGILDLATDKSQAVSESFSKFVMADLGFPRSVQQKEFWVGNRHYYTDFFFENENTGGESDGLIKMFGTDVADDAERIRRYKARLQRDRDLRTVCNDVLHWGWAEIMNPQRLRAVLVAGGIKPSPANRPW
ncbi:MAG: hypothetical protein ACTH9H_06210 [Galactobacter sp.]